MEARQEPLTDYELAFEFFRIKHEQEKLKDRLKLLKQDELNLLKQYPFLGNLKGVIEKKQEKERQELEKKKKEQEEAKKLAQEQM